MDILKISCLILLIIQLCSKHVINQQDIDAADQRRQSKSSKESLAPQVVRILALFSGTNNELGIDHRLGRQVLKLAANRAKQLYPNELAQVELTVHSDDTECTNLNVIPSMVAEQFYLGSSSNLSTSGSQSTECSFSDNRGSLECKADGDLFDLNRHLSGPSAKLGPHKADKASTSRPQQDQIDAIIGPSCDFLVDLVARMAAYWRCPVYSVASVGSSFARKDVYTTLTRLSPSIDHLTMFVVKTLERFSWRHVAIIADERQVDSKILLDSLVATISRVRYLIPLEQKVFSFSSFGSTIQASTNRTGTDESPLSEGENQQEASDEGQCTREARRVLLAARKVARVFVFLFSDQQVVRRLLLCANQLQMNNGEFTYLAINLGLKSIRAKAILGTERNATISDGNEKQASKSTRLRASQNFDWYQVDDESNNEIAKQMFEALMVFSVELPIGDEFNLFVEQSLEMVQQNYPEVRFERTSVGALAVALHDSLLLAVEAHLRTSRWKQTNSSSPLETERSRTNYQAEKALSALEELEELEDGDRRFESRQVALMWGEHYSDGLIAGLHINDNGDQELDYMLSDLERDTGVMKPVLGYSRETRQVRTLPDGYIQWPKRMDSVSKLMVDIDEPPADEPECGFNDDAERCVDRQNLYAALSIVSVLALLVALVAMFSLYKYRHIKYQMQLDDYWWKINWLDLHFIQATEGSLTSNAQSVARALHSGASVVSAASSDGSHSMVSIVRTGGGAKATRPKPEEAQQQSAGRPSLVPRLNKRRSAVPLIAVSDSDKMSSKGPKQTAEDGADETASSAQHGSALAAGTCLIRSEYSSVVKFSNLAMYKNELVIVKQLNGRSISVTRELLVELKSMREFINDNLAKFVGLCVEPERVAIVYEYCSRGSLQDLLLNKEVAMDWTLKYSIIGDLVNGLNFIHTTLLDYHGRLKSTNLVLDSRFTVKITDFGIQNLYSQLEEIEDNESDEDDGDEQDDDDDAASQKPTSRISGQRRAGKPKQADQVSLSVSQSVYNMESVSVRDSRVGGSSRAVSSNPSRSRILFKNRGAAKYFWTAPEHLRDKNLRCAGSKKGDVYSLAVIFLEIFTRKEPYYYGTSAKPHWATIKPERRALQPSGAGSGTQTGSITRPRNQSVSQQSQISEPTQSLISSLGRSAQGKLKRATAQVNPIKAKPVSSSANQADAAAAETTSLKSVSSQVSASRASTSQAELSASAALVRSQPVATDPTPRPLRLSVTTIGEEDSSDLSSLVGDKATIALSPEKRIDAEEILDQLRMGIEPDPVRPFIPNYILQDINPKLVELMRSCWAESATTRPSVAQVRNALRRITKGVASKNYLDNLLERLQSYAEDLERVVDGKSTDILEEKLRIEELLYQLVPKFVAERLSRNEPIIPQVFDGVTIFFSDIVGFERYASLMSPSELVDLLNSIYSSFESIISSFDVTKIETIIDQFLVASGISWQQQQLLLQAADPVVASGGSQPVVPVHGSIESPADEAEDGDGTGSKAKPVSRSRSLGKRRGLFRALHRRHKQGNGGSGSLEQTDDSLELVASNNSLDRPQAAGGEPANTNKASPELQSHYKRASAEQIARMALCIRDLVKSFHFRQNLASASGDNMSQSMDQTTSGQQSVNIVAATFNIRIGMHSGKVCAGIVGMKRPKFCLIGDTVNVASRMHTNSKANRIQISADTKELLEQVPGFSIEARGQIEVKGKGMMETFWLESSY